MSVAETPAKKGPLPEGSIPVGIGLFISGVSAYVFQAIAARALDEDPNVALGQMWLITFALAPGFFLPVEQEVARALSHRRALGQGGAPVVRRAAVLFVAIVTVLFTGLAIAYGPLVNEVLHDSTPLYFGLLLGIAGFASTYVLRGLLSGNAMFNQFGLLLGVDGILRVVAAGGLWLAGVESPGAYGLLVGVPPFIAIAIAGLRAGELMKPGPPSSWQEIAPNMGWLLGGSVMAASLVQAGPFAANLLAEESQKGLVEDFFQAVLIARLPLFMFQAIQAALLPRLAQLAAQREMAEFEIRLKRLMVAVTAIGIAGVIGAWALGPWALEIGFNANVTRRTMTLLAIGSAFYMLAVALAQAVIALESHARVAIGWAIAVITFIASVAFIANDLLLRVELGLIVASAVAFAYFAGNVNTLLGRPNWRSSPSADTASALGGTSG
jgi:O-antigen/teichoic acid export membrane protein